MEFDEMKKIWDTQNNEPLYVLNENAFHNHIRLKKRKAGHIANLSELLIIWMNIGAGAFVVGVCIINKITDIYMYILAAWMFVTAIGVIPGRIRRINAQAKFDRTILGDLDQAIATASYQVVLSGILRWNMLPMGVLIMLVVWDSDNSIWWAVAMLAFFALSYFGSGWEHNYYKSRKREVEQLRNVLLTEAGNVP